MEVEGGLLMAEQAESNGRLGPSSRSSRSRSIHTAAQKKQQPTDGSKLLRNDEVYRQLFESQVQLADQVSAVRWYRENRPKVKVYKSSRDLSLPVVRNAVDRGMLNDSQTAWALALDNQDRVENPVARRQLAEWLDLVGAESEAQQHAGEVADLPDIVRPSKLKSDVIDRIKEKRRERHNLTLEEMHQELYQVGVKYEPQYQHLCEQLQESLRALEAELEEVMAPIRDTQQLTAMTHAELQLLWQRAASLFEQRQSLIQKLDEQLRQLEQERVADLRQIFRNYSDIMERVSHLAPAELHRIIDEEAMQVNQTLLGNQRNLADLSARLLMAELQRERRLRAEWQEKISDWRDIHQESGVASFAEFMSSSEVQQPQSLEAILADMRKEQSDINAQRLQLIEELKSLAPPNASKSDVAAWYQKMQLASKQLDESNQRYLRRVYEDYERVCALCLEEMQRFQNEMVTAGVADEEKASSITRERCLPLVSQQQRRFEDRLGALDQLFEANTKRVGVQLKSLYKLAQGASHLWDRHEISLASLERELADRLDANRQQHDRQNQEREAQLDVVMDKLRQEYSEQGLKFQLNRALEMLKAIEATYHKFHSEQQQEVRAYPKLVDEEVDGLERGVCEFFGLERATKKKIDRKRTKAALKPAELAKIKAKQEAKRNEEEDWIKAAFREILLTSRGSEFRVLTEAGVHGVPPDDAAAAAAHAGQQPGNKHGHITMPQADANEAQAEADENVRCASISQRLVLEAKVQIRQNFLDFVDTWRQEAAQRSNGVVSAKLEELEAELRLRLHLHEPRARRAELDVQNVRAAELVLHSERVTRHTKGVQQTLDLMKAEFAAMNEQHDKLMTDFITNIEGMENSYTNATKSTRLVSLSSKCSSEVNSFMSHIRTSLREFRQGLDEKLQMLRESNARFIKSFKLFSEGGNFCPEEVEDYRKRLDKMTGKVDAAESSILSELEGMEKRRLDAANAKVKEFEDQFRNHMVDLVFMESVARWLTNTQVKIKAEVADSNSQSLKLQETLDTLERRADACARPNLDKETVLPADLHQGLHEIFDMFNDRSVYLNCIGTQRSPPVVVTVGDAPADAGASAAAQAADSKLVRLQETQTTPISKSGKQPQEDPACGTIRKIIRTQRARVHGAEVVIDAEKEEAASSRDRKAKRRPQQQQQQHQQQQLQHQQSKEPDGSQELSPAAPVSDNTRTPSLQGGGQASVTKINSRRGSHVPELPHQVNRRTSASRKFVAKNQRLDKKYLVFGEADDQVEGQHFLGRIRRICREALDGTLLAAELYYRQKGSRPVTRPQALHETFDQCAEVIIPKLQAYFSQSDTYHNACVIELRDQLVRLERLIDEVPELTFKELYETSAKAAEAALRRVDEGVSSQLEQLQQRRQRHEEGLSPALGHPERLLKLQQLCEAEELRHQELIALLASVRSEKLEALLKVADSFAQEVSQLSEMLLIKLDSLLTSDEVERGRQPPQLEPTAALLRKQLAGQPLQDPSKEHLIARGKANWPGLPLNEFQLPAESPKSLRHATLIVTAKTTMAHNQTDRARRRYYQAFKEFFHATLDAIRQQNQEAETLEARWYDNWTSSVQRIKELY